MERQQQLCELSVPQERARRLLAHHVLGGGRVLPQLDGLLAADREQIDRL